MERSLGQISDSKKRKECPELDDYGHDEEEEKMEKFYEIIRSFRYARGHLISNSNIIMTKNVETTEHKLVENIELIKKKKKKKTDDKEKEAVVATMCTEHDQTNELLGSKGTTTLEVTMNIDEHRGDQDHDTHGLDLNFSL
ncbi:hypothetical protein K7X08_008390 [Anisodus acutangulus]|uniref:Uncharacterized protein n=1 Tax=Anisodus acutangulus TaxID=402998 RepID=A0A9Q1MQC6_9SOLA|nr:hypothetical protein K7X08_008390 [Anisodus acutangulus]